MDKIRQWLLLVLFGLIILNFTHIVYFNIFTHSLPYGVYIKIQSTPQRGDYAASCLTQEIAQYGINRRYLAQGNCDTGTVLVLKMIKGLPGDSFVVKDGFLELNGYSYPIIGKDSSGRTLKVFYKEKEGVLEKGKYILLSDFSKNSWDSRYWGPVSIQFLLKPLWIFENIKEINVKHP
jgi:conjugative transfer signal peptidase TraF